MFGYTGDDLAVFALCVSLGVPFGWEAVKEGGWRRAVAGALCAVFLLFGLFWSLIKAEIPVVGSATTSIATNLETWTFLVFLAFGLFFLTSPALVGRRSQEDTRIPELQVQVADLSRQASLLRNMIRNMERRPRPDVNWTIWKQRTAYTLPEFAAILADIDPAGSKDTPERGAFLKLLQESAMDAKIPVIKDRNADDRYGPDTWPEYFTVNKAAAIKWASERKFDVSHIE